MSEPIYYFEYASGALVEMTAKDITAYVRAKGRRVSHPAKLTRETRLALWPQDIDALLKLREIEESERSK